METNNNYEKIKKEIEVEKQRRKEEDKKNKKIINQIKTIDKLKSKLSKEEAKLNELIENTQNTKEEEKI
ncbi:hypothetical protein [Campylobacter lari]|uniref:hypothetical protein n=1 Tax=Campylobacter lari TaxID=201 RepID=UPI000873D39A|nr:hypothetical protein [Campylobacter lari]EAK0768200.1 hypothetical protein [Campylobacter lari]EDP6895634.1 hypothetical protein [Campylobacter lari]EJV5920780.1 hypothetical protein [Campylobacter lari]MCV3399071.1 hypothetical protein [Campylobacter lari]MCV3414615.1 hypothetical protein [Campylobacter lari]